MPLVVAGFFFIIHELLFHGLCGSIANVEVAVTLLGI